MGRPPKKPTLGMILMEVEADPQNQHPSSRRPVVNQSSLLKKKTLGTSRKNRPARFHQNSRRRVEADLRNQHQSSKVNRRSPRKKKTPGTSRRNLSARLRQDSPSQALNGPKLRVSVIHGTSRKSRSVQFQRGNLQNQHQRSRRLLGTLGRLPKNLIHGMTLEDLSAEFSSSSSSRAGQKKSVIRGTSRKVLSAQFRRSSQSLARNRKGRPQENPTLGTSPMEVEVDLPSKPQSRSPLESQGRPQEMRTLGMSQDLLQQFNQSSRRLVSRGGRLQQSPILGMSPTAEGAFPRDQFLHSRSHRGSRVPVSHRRNQIHLIPQVEALVLHQSRRSQRPQRSPTTLLTISWVTSRLAATRTATLGCRTRVHRRLPRSHEALPAAPRPAAPRPVPRPAATWLAVAKTTTLATQAGRRRRRSRPRPRRSPQHLRNPPRRWISALTRTRRPARWVPITRGTERGADD